MDNVLRSECDHRLLHRLVRNELREDERQVVEQHLNHCDQCARQVCEDATIDWDWEAVQHSLGSDDFDIGDWMSGRRGECDEIESPTINQVTDRTDRPAVLMREISGWLDPTDDPNMMGRFAGYEIVGIVGHGGMGIVLKGFESSLNRYVAIKILAPRLATNGAARKRFSREAQAAAAVRHDNVIAVHRVDERHGLPFLVMPYVAGISLQNRMDDEGPLSVEAILRIGSQVAAGLAAAHAQGLVHRDIKPANILLENGVERVTITDFGLARAIDDATITRTGIIAGTPQFMSPEQAQAKPLDHRSDLFSLGSLMYAMATGRPPFRSDDNHEILQKISSDKTRGVREIQPYVPEWLSDIIDWLHEKSPSDRPQSAAEVAELLEAWLAHLQNPDTVPAPDRPISLSSTRKARPSSHWRQGLPVIAAGAIALLAGIIFIVETGKGTVRIESNIDGAPIIVSRDDKVVETLTVTQEGASIRLAAGFYRIQIGGGIDGVTIDRETIRLRRGEEIVAHVHATDPEAILVGEIVDISRNGTVELSIGSDDGVFVGMEFIVLNDNDDKTLLQVTDVIAHAALAKPTGGHRENAVKNGDRVQQVVENKSLNVKERGVLSAGLNIAVNQILDRLRSAHELKGRSSGQWGDELVRFAMCEGHRSTEIALLYGDELAAFGFTTPVYDLNNRTLVAEIAFRKRLPDGTWELIHVDMEPPDGAARDLANFRRNRPDARELTTEPDDLRPDVVLKHARSDDFEDAGMTTNELIGKWRVASVTGSGRGAVGDEPIGEFVEFGAHTMTTFRDENRSQKSVLGYTLDEHGKLQLQVIRSEKLAEIILGRAEYGHNSLNLALNISAPNSQFPVSANPDEVESNVKYFHLIREPQTEAERLDCEERDQMYLRLKNAKRQASPDSFQADQKSSESLSENITGSVVEVGENGLVELSVGSDDGVSEGMWFAVLRGGNIVANARVKKVSQDHAIATVEWRFNNSFVAPHDQIVELHSPDRERRGRASNDCFDSVKVTRTEATINGVFRHPGKLILQIGDALPETELRSELKLPVGSFVAEIMYVVEHKDTDYERPRIAMRVAKSGTDFASAKYSTVTIPLQVENLAQDRRLRFREGGHHIATLDGSSSSQALNKIVFADVILKSGGKIPVSLVAEQIVREEQADHSGLYRQIKQLSSRFRRVDDPKAIKSDPWGELVEEIRTHRGHKSVRFGVLYADDSSAVGISIPIGHDDGELLGVRITAGVKDGKWQITDIDVQPMDDSKNELRKFVEEHPNAIPHGTQLQDEITDLGSSEQPTYRSMSPKASSDLSRLQGAWAMIEYTGADGKQDLKIDHQKHEAPFRIAINGNKFTGPYFPLPMLGGPRESVIELAPDKSPKEMRLTTDLDDGTKEIAHLLYRFQGDKLELSFVDDEAYRLLPADFPNEKPTGRIATATFRRISAKEQPND